MQVSGCNVCDKTVKCDHMAKQDVIKQCNTQGHQDRAISLKSQSKLNFGIPNSDREVTMRTEAEVRMAVLTASCNIPLAFHDKLSRCHRPSTMRMRALHANGATPSPSQWRRRGFARSWRWL